MGTLRSVAFETICDGGTTLLVRIMLIGAPAAYLSSPGVNRVDAALIPSGYNVVGDMEA